MVLGPHWSTQDWLTPGGGAHNAIVTITYLNGTIQKAIVLSHDEHEIRALASGCDDVVTFQRIRGAWISEELEPVTIEFAWQRRLAAAPSENDCICPKELAARLIRTLFAGCEPERATTPPPAGSRLSVGCRA